MRSSDNWSLCNVLTWLAAVRPWEYAQAWCALAAARPARHMWGLLPQWMALNSVWQKGHAQAMQLSESRPCAQEQLASRLPCSSAEPSASSPRQCCLPLRVQRCMTSWGSVSQRHWILHGSPKLYLCWVISWHGCTSAQRDCGRMRLQSYSFFVRCAGAVSQPVSRCCAFPLFLISCTPMRHEHAWLYDACGIYSSAPYIPRPPPAGGAWMERPEGTAQGSASTSRSRHLLVQQGSGHACLQCARSGLPGARGGHRGQPLPRRAGADLARGQVNQGKF